MPLKSKETATKKRSPKPKACSASLSSKGNYNNGGHNKWHPAYDPAMVELVDEMYEAGCADVQICHRLKISRETFYKWAKDESKPEFMEAVRQGKLSSESWWQHVGQEAAAGTRKISEKIWIMMMKNRFGFEDRVKIEDCTNGALAHTINKLTNITNELEKKFERDH